VQLLMTLQVFSGDMREARCYLLDAQRFVSRFGIEQSAKSRKVRMLHSVYLYLRILEESTDIQLREDQSDEQSGDYHGLRPVSTSGIRASIWADDLTLTPANIRYGSLVSLGIHPACSIDSIAIFEQIYSIPVSLFKMIAQATEVAREMENLRKYGLSPGIDVDLLWTEVKVLEQQICDWKNQYGEHGSDQVESLPREALLYHLAEAIHAALMIFFYRRVRDMHSGAVQHWVRQTADHLLTVERLKLECGDRSANLCWPGFIAGCEATEAQTRQRWSEWFTRSYKDSRIRMFDVAKVAMENIWRTKDTSGSCAHSWSEALRGATDSTRLVLS
jgi:arginine metabolism regulation protein II